MVIADIFSAHELQLRIVLYAFCAVSALAFSYVVAVLISLIQIAATQETEKRG